MDPIVYMLQFTPINSDQTQHTNRHRIPSTMNLHYLHPHPSTTSQDLASVHGNFITNLINGCVCYLG